MPLPNPPPPEHPAPVQTPPDDEFPPPKMLPPVDELPTAGFGDELKGQESPEHCPDATAGINPNATKPKSKLSSLDFPNILEQQIFMASHSKAYFLAH